MRIVCDNAHHDAGEGVCVFCVNNRITDAVHKERGRLLKWAQEQSRSHHKLSVDAYDQKAESVGDIHNSLSSAYSRLADEIRRS